MSEDDTISNHSGNRPFEEVLEVNMQRRKVLRGGLALAATGLFAASGAAQALPGPGRGRYGSELIGFTPVTLSRGGGLEPAVSPDCEFDVILPWGDPLEPGGPASGAVTITGVCV